MSGFYYENGCIFRGKEPVLRLQISERPGVRELVEERAPGLFCWERRIRKREAGTQDFLRAALRASLTEPVKYYMIPGVLYNGNPWGEGREPKGTGRNGVPWTFAWHRSGIPAGLFCQSKRWAAGMWGDIGCGQGFSGSLEAACGAEIPITMCIHFPEQEGPQIYCARDTYLNESCYAAAVSVGEELVLRVFLWVREAEEPFDYGAYLDTVWNMYREYGRETPEAREPQGEKGRSGMQRREPPQKTVCTPKNGENGANEEARKRKVWELGIRFLTESAWFEEREFCGFCMGLTWNGTRWEQKRDYLEIGWVGQNASCAVSLLYDGLLARRRAHLEQGLKILDCWTRGMLPNGLFRCRYDRIQAWGSRIRNREERQDAANLYGAAAEYLEAYRLLKAHGIERERYRSLALGICGFALRAQEPGGRMGKAWYNDGSCCGREGGIGCYMVLTLCLGYEETGEKAYLEGAARGFSYYYGAFLRDGFTTAGALDTCCIDKESALPLLKTALFLYEHTGEAHYLKCAGKVSYYIATWQYHYNVKFPSESVLGQLGYRTRGGTAVSVQHHHIDCYGLLIYEDWLKLARYTGTPLWEERAEAVWENSLQNISDGALAVKGQLRPAGSQDEGVLQTRWHTKRGEAFGVSEWLVVWNTALRLKVLRKEYLSSRGEKRKEDGRM